MAQRRDGDVTAELLTRALRLVAQLSSDPPPDAMDVEACFAIATTLEDLAGEVARLRDALRGHGAVTEEEIEAAVQRGRAALRVPNLPPGGKPLAALRVAVVDDEPDTLEALVVVLENAGASVWAYPDAVSALAGTHVCRPHVLVSDLAMPGYDGLWLVRQVRGTAHLGRLPALALSAHALRADVQDATSAGFDAHLAKPTLPDRLIAEVLRLAATLAPPAAAPDEFEDE